MGFHHFQLIWLIFVLEEKTDKNRKIFSENIYKELVWRYNDYR